MIRSKYIDINYNGLTDNNIDQVLKLSNETTKSFVCLSYCEI